MTAPIAAIGALAPVAPLNPAGAVGASTGATGSLGATSGANVGGNFATALGHGLDQVAGAQANANDLAVQAATGALTDPAQLTIATTQATLMTQLMTTIQSKAVTAFNTVMGMQA